MSHIVVLGATGRTGGATARKLLERGASVRAVVRDAESPDARALADAGAQIVTADLDRPDTLPAAFEGARAAFNVQAGFDERGRYDGPKEVAQGRAVASAAAAGGVAHVVTVAAGPGFALGLPHCDGKLEIRDAMIDAGLSVTALFPAPYMELMTDPSFVPAASTFGAKPRVLGWDSKIPWVCTDDIGAAAAECLVAEERYVTADVPLIAEERSLRECRELLAAAGRSPRRLPMPVWLFRKMVGNELPDMWQWMAMHPEQAYDRAPLRELIGQPTSVAAWIANSSDEARSPASVTA